MTTKTLKTLKKALREGPYAWPGGYPLFFVMSDGGALCFTCTKNEYRLIYGSTRDQLDDGWCAAGVDVNWEDVDLLCAHCGNPIESAYGGEDNECS